MKPGPPSCTRWGVEVREFLETRAWDLTAKALRHPVERRTSPIHRLTLQGLLSNPQGELERHVVQCATCGRRGRRLIGVVDLIAHLPRHEAPPQLAPPSVDVPSPLLARSGLESMLRSLPRHSAPAALDDHLEALLRGATRNEPVPGEIAGPNWEPRLVPTSRRRWPALVAAAALVLILGILGGLLESPRPEPSFVGPRTGLRLEFRSPQGLYEPTENEEAFLDILAGWAAPLRRSPVQNEARDASGR